MIPWYVVPLSWVRVVCSVQDRRSTLELEVLQRYWVGRLAGNEMIGTPCTTPVLSVVLLMNLHSNVLESDNS